MPDEATDHERVDQGARAYCLVVPPGFIRIPGDASTAPEDVLEQLAFEGEVPASTDEFVTFLNEVESHDPHRLVQESYVAVSDAFATDVHCSFVVARLPVKDPTRGDLDSLLLSRVRRGATATSLGGEPAVVWESDAGDVRTVGSRRSRLLRRRTVLGRIRGSRLALIAVSLTVTAPARDERPDDDTVAAAFAELFDAVVTTFRWIDGQGAVISDRPTT